MTTIGRCWITFNRNGEPMYAHADQREALEAVHNGGMAEAVEYVTNAADFVKAVREYLAAVDEDDRVATAETEAAKATARAYLDFALSGESVPTEYPDAG